MHMKKVFVVAAMSAGVLAASSFPVLAENIGNSDAASSAKVACVGTAVASREQSVDTAFSTYTQAMNAAYSARTAALAAAYREPDTQAVAAAVKAAWKTFNASTKKARAAWRASRDTSWKTFRTNAKTCRAPLSILDTSSAGSELSGN